MATAWPLASLTPAKRSAIGATPAGVTAASRDLGKDVAAQNDGGFMAINFVADAQLPIVIVT